MRRNCYRGYYTNGSVKNVKKIFDKRGFKAEDFLAKESAKELEPVSKPVKSYCYCKRKTGCESFRIEKKTPVCDLCDMRCFCPEVFDWNGYKTKSKGKVKGHNKFQVID
jgi:hypothetical protein